MRGNRRRLPDWLDLFDLFEIEHACDVVREDVRAAAHGGRSLAHLPIRRFLVGPLNAYMAAKRLPPGRIGIHTEAARRLRDLAEDLAERFERGEPFTNESADAWAARLRSAWHEFVAAGAGHRMYSDLPKEHAQRVKAARHRRGGWPSFLTLDDVAEVMTGPGAPRKYEAVISALCDRARANAADKPPKGNPEAAAKRAYGAAVKAGRIKAISQRVKTRRIKAVSQRR